MDWLASKNLLPVRTDDVPHVEPNRFRDEVVAGVQGGWRVVTLFGDRDGGKVNLYAVLADDHQFRLYLLATSIDQDGQYPAITPEVPSCHLFERELFEQFNIRPVDHPWLKPVRRGIAGISETERAYSFFRMEGDEVHEVGVGPIHAGIIEPGYFRFSCQGEEVVHLEIQLGFQHRGIENLFVAHNNHPLYLLKLAESIAGDTVIGHGGCFVRALEALGGVDAPRRARSLRTVALELERVANHLGDLSALCNDVAYLTGHAAFGALRTRVINTTMAACGSRFGRGWLRLGGVSDDNGAEGAEAIWRMLDPLERDVDLAGDVLFASASVMSRFEKTGIVSREAASQLGMVGPPGRASGLSLDVRSDHPYDEYATFPVHKITLDSGDVFARAYIRYVEIKHAIRILREQLAALPGGEGSRPVADLQPNALVVSMSEGWRGEVVHVALTGGDTRLRRYKVKDPSFHNWFALALAVRGNGISDFPLCNKSFNLSYCGFDL